LDNDRIKIATSQPNLKNKIKTNIDGATDVIYWYIRFNIPLDESTVSDKTMDVTDTEGYIMRTDISYSKTNRMICISPLDTYEQNRFYLLNVNKKVKSESGKPLKTTLHILFKLYDNKISEYRILKSTAKLPKPRPRPNDYDEQQIKKRKTGSGSASDMIVTEGRDKMSPVGYKINMMLGVVGLLAIAGSLFLDSLWAVGLAALVCLGGMAHIFVQLANKSLRSSMLYNKGVRQFNNGDYKEAEISFKRSLMCDPTNAKAENGIYRTSFY